MEEALIQEDYRDSDKGKGWAASGSYSEDGFSSKADFHGHLPCLYPIHAAKVTRSNLNGEDSGSTVSY